MIRGIAAHDRWLVFEMEGEDEEGLDEEGLHDREFSPPSGLGIQREPAENP